MKKMKNILKIGAGFLLIGLLLIPNISAICDDSIQKKENVYLFINGGFGVHFTVINENEETVDVGYDIYGEGLFFNTTWHTHGSFSAAPDVWTTSPPVLVPYSFMPITAYLYQDGKVLMRKGFSLFGFTLFIM